MYIKEFFVLEFENERRNELFMELLHIMVDECLRCPNMVWDEEKQVNRTISDQFCINSECKYRDMLIKTNIANFEENVKDIGLCDDISIEIDDDETEVNDDQLRMLAKNNSNIFVEDSKTKRLYFVGNLVSDNYQNDIDDEDDEEDFNEDDTESDDCSSCH